MQIALEVVIGFVVIVGSVALVAGALTAIGAAIVAGIAWLMATTRGQVALMFIAAVAILTALTYVPH
jgi:hypothetical protein